MRRTALAPDEVHRRISLSPSGCWLWMGSVFQNSGYGRIKVSGRTMVAHRFAYEVLRGPIPGGLTLDHLCRVRRCVNPDHLEPVTPRVNVLRGETITARNAGKTQCDRGHPLAGANLFVRKDGRRRCRECERRSQRRLRSTDEYRRKHAQYARALRARKAAP